MLGFAHGRAPRRHRRKGAGISPAHRSGLSRLYDTTAWFWDSPVHCGIYRAAYVRLFQELDADGWFGEPGRSLRVLDCGTGTGLLASSMAEGARRQLDLWGIDTSTVMLERARRRLERSGIRTGRLARADLCALPFGDGTMDVVMTALALEHANPPARAVREMARVGRPGATVLVIATRQHAPDLPFRWAFHYEPFPEELVVQWMVDAGVSNGQPKPLSGIARWLAKAYIGTKAE